MSFLAMFLLFPWACLAGKAVEVPLLFACIGNQAQVLKWEPGMAL